MLQGKSSNDDLFLKKFLKTEIFKRFADEYYQK